jgi:hypothetical protein
MKNLLKNIYLKFKNFKYKTITSILFFAILGIIGYNSGIPIFVIISKIIFILLVIYILFLFFKGVYNLYKKDDDKGSAIFFLIIGLSFVALLLYIIFK